MDIDDPLGGVDAEPFRDFAARTEDRQIRQLRVGQQHIDVIEYLRAVTIDQCADGALDHVDVGLVVGSVVAEVRGAEHRVVPQIVGVAVLGVPLCGNTVFGGEVGGDVDQADGRLVHHARIQSGGVIGSPLRWRYSAIA